MDSHLILDIHLIELIDTADTMVSQHESAGFNAEFTSLWVLEHRCCQTCGV